MVTLSLLLFRITQDEPAIQGLLRELVNTNLSVKSPATQHLRIESICKMLSSYPSQSLLECMYEVDDGLERDPSQYPRKSDLYLSIYVLSRYIFEKPKRAEFYKIVKPDDFFDPDRLGRSQEFPWPWVDHNGYRFLARSPGLASKYLPDSIREFQWLVQNGTRR